MEFGETKKFSQCPVCGSTERIVETETKKEIEAGNIRPNMRVPASISQSQVLDVHNQKILLTRRQFPMMIGFYDICASCGTLYCVEIAKNIGILEPKMQSRPPGTFNPGQIMSN